MVTNFLFGKFHNDDSIKKVMKKWVSKKIDRTRMQQREREREFEKRRIHKTCNLPSLTFLFADVI